MLLLTLFPFFLIGVLGISGNLNLCSNCENGSCPHQLSSITPSDGNCYTQPLAINTTTIESFSSFAFSQSINDTWTLYGYSDSDCSVDQKEIMDGSALKCYGTYININGTQFNGFFISSIAPHLGPGSASPLWIIGAVSGSVIVIGVLIGGYFIRNRQGYSTLT